MLGTLKKAERNKPGPWIIYEMCILLAELYSLVTVTAKNVDLHYRSVLFVDFKRETFTLVSEKILPLSLFDMEVITEGLYDVLLRVTYSQPIGEFVGRPMHGNLFD